MGPSVGASRSTAVISVALPASPKSVRTLLSIGWIYREYVSPITRSALLAMPPSIIDRAIARP